MDSFLFFSTIGFALIFVIEGLLYAIFPRHIQNMMRYASMMPFQKFRSFGLAMFGIGALMLWILQKL